MSYARLIKTAITVLVCAVSGFTFTAISAKDVGSKNGFVLSNPSIPIKEIRRGGPPRDGIPALYMPRTIPATQADFLNPTDRILGVTINKQSRAYPIRILNHHEIVNDVLDGQPIIVSFCPLCGSGMVFDAWTETGLRTFGVSGLLYNSDVLMYDRQTESLWSQIMGEAVTGKDSGTTLKSLAVRHTTWQDWRTSHPDTSVLSSDTGYQRRYDIDPYKAYRRAQRSLMFPVSKKDKRYLLKTMVVGLKLDGQARAWPFTELAQQGGQIRDRISNKELLITYDAKNESAYISHAGVELPSLMAYWFAWYAFNPETSVYVSED